LKEIRESWRVRFSMGKEENSSIEELQLIFQESINKGAKKQSSKLKVRFTFYDLLDKYMEQYKNRYAHTHLKKFLTVKNSLRGYYPTLEYSDLTTELFDDYRDKLVKSSLSNNYIKDLFKII